LRNRNAPRHVQHLKVYAPRYSLLITINPDINDF